MREVSAIEMALQNVLPAELHAHLPDLARILADVAAGTLSNCGAALSTASVASAARGSATAVESTTALSDEELLRALNAAPPGAPVPAGAPRARSVWLNRIARKICVERKHPNG